MCIGIFDYKFISYLFSSHWYSVLVAEGFFKSAVCCLSFKNIHDKLVEQRINSVSSILGANNE